MIKALTIIDVIVLSTSLICAVLSLLLGYIFFSKNRKTPIYIHFFILSITLFILGCGQFLFLVFNYGYLRDIFVRITSLALFFFPAVFVHFIVKMADFKEYSKNRIFYISVFYFPAFLFSLLPFLNRLVMSTTQAGEKMLVLVPAQATTAFLIYVLTHYIYCVFFLFWYRRSNLTKDLKKKTDIMLTGTTIAFLFGLIPEIIFETNGIITLRFGILVLLISLSIIALALYRFRYHVHIPDAFFKALMEIMSDVLIVLDPTGKIIYSSQSTNSILGYSTDDLYLMDFKGLFKDKDKPLFYKDGKPVFPYDRIIDSSRKETITNHDIELENNIGILIPLNVTISPFISDEFGRYYFLLIGKDIREITNLISEINSYKNDLEEKVKDRTKELRKINEELKETQASLIQTEKISAMGMLAGGVAHEINTPLSGVLGYVELLINKIESKQINNDFDLVLEKLRIVRECGYRCKSIAEKFLDFSRKSEKKFTPVSIHSIIEDSLMVTRNQIKYDVTVLKEYDKDLPLIYCDGNELQQVFVNLVINAKDAMPKKGILKFITKRVDDDVVIEFSDNGEGIEEENMQNIFKAFFTTKPAGKGTGLGLSVSAGIIKKHMGKMEVKSKKGEGTTFIISLPVLDKARELLNKKQKV
ncbi:MAG: PAS domain S-box protein [Candidatus Aureabacteria bacterium]|nr:PAS domain S-box protein [Candidatus Auribacterota bacterium]